MDIPNIKPKLKKTSSVEPLKYERKRRASSVRLLQHAGKGEGERVFAENTGIAEIIDKMLKNKEDYAIQLNGCKIMGSFAQHASLEVIVARPKGITLLVDAMSQFVDKLEIQSAAIESLSKFAEGHSPEICCMHIISSGGLSALWQAMKRFPEENNLHFMSLKCVCSMSIHEAAAQHPTSAELGFSMEMSKHFKITSRAPGIITFLQRESKK